MLDREELKHIAGSTIYQRGEDIYRQGGVVDFRATLDEDGDEGIDRIAGVVKGSGRKLYGVEMVYDAEYDELVDYYF